MSSYIKDVAGSVKVEMNAITRSASKVLAANDSDSPGSLLDGNSIFDDSLLPKDSADIDVDKALFSDGAQTVANRLNDDVAHRPTASDFNGLSMQGDDTKSDVHAFRLEQRSDPSLTSIFDKLNTCNTYDNYFIHDLDQLLYHKETINTFVVVQLVVPFNRTHQVLKFAHNSVWAGHLGYEKSFERIRCNFYWPCMKAEIKDYCASCKDCQLRKKRMVFDNVPIEPVIRAGSPFQTMHFNFAGPLGVKSNGFDYCLVVVDSFSKWIDLVPLKNLTAKSTCEGLLQVFARTSIRSVLVSDEASNNVAKLTIEFERMLGISPRFSTPYHPKE